ncbi:MAG: OmpH family outer membrane protein [Bacteroidota bacterium]
MNKISLPVSMIAIALAVFSIFNLKSSNELVYVDVNKLLEGYKRTEVVRKDLQEKTTLLKTNIDSLVADFQNQLKLYEKDRVAMSEKEQKLQEELLSGKQQQINSYRQSVQKQFQQEDQKATQTVINDINDYVNEYGKKHGYRIIFGAGGNGNIMYAENGTDLTEAVLEGLNTEFESK